MFYSKAISLLRADSLLLGSTEVISELELSSVPASELAEQCHIIFHRRGDTSCSIYWQPDDVNADSFWQWSGRACTRPDAQDHFRLTTCLRVAIGLALGMAVYIANGVFVFFECSGGTDLASAADIVVEAGQTTLVDADRDFAQKLFLPVIQR